MTSVDSSAFKCASLSLSFLQKIMLQNRVEKLLQQLRLQSLCPSRHSEFTSICWSPGLIHRSQLPQTCGGNETSYKYMTCLQVSTHLEPVNNFTALKWGCLVIPIFTYTSQKLELLLETTNKATSAFSISVREVFWESLLLLSGLS